MSYAAEPKAPKPDPSTAPQEPTGPVASDSLAAESTRAGGGFSENENIASLSVKGANSTLANTDTSGATVLHAAKDGAAREKEDSKGLGSDEMGSAGGVKYPDAEVPEFTGTHSQEGYVGGSSADTQAAGGSTVAESFSGATGDSFADGGAGVTSSSSSDDAISSSTRSSKITSSSGSSDGPAPGTGATAVGASGSIDSADTAPNYAATVSGALRPEGEDQPKGKNLTEGGVPETKTFTGNVGGDKDPGRLAEQKFEKINADTAAGVGGGKKGDDENPFGVLGSERA